MAGFDMEGLFDATRRQVSNLFGGSDQASAAPGDSISSAPGAFTRFIMDRPGITDPFANSRLGSPTSYDPLNTIAQISNSGMGGPGSFGDFSMGPTTNYDPFAWSKAMQEKYGPKIDPTTGKGTGKEATAPNAGSKSSSAPAGLPTDQWRGLIEQAARENGVDPDTVEAIMLIESPTGNPKEYSPAGAIGLMQVMPMHFSAGEDPWDPATNIRVGVRYFAEQYKRYGTYDKAAAAYLGAIDANGNITTDKDAYGTDGFAYVNKFNTNLNLVKQKRQAAQSSAAPTQSRGFSAITGGIGDTMQEFGDTDYSNANPAVYEYGRQYGTSGHTGVDIGLARGSQLYVPKSATVLNAGGTGVFCDNQGCGPGQGELRLQLDDGSILILGHMAQINVQAGQRLTAGQAVGLSGDSDGPHVHVEMRIRDASTPSGWRIVDARRYL